MQVHFKGGCLKFFLSDTQAEAVRGSAGLNGGIESVRGSKFPLRGLLPGLRCGPCGLSVRVGEGYRVRFYGPSLSVFLNSRQVLFLTTYPQVILRLLLRVGLFLNEAAKVTGG